MSADLLILLGGIIAVGFLGTILFEKLKIPEVLFLIGVGIAVGPGLGLATADSVGPFMSSFGTIALTIIVFEGALGLDVKGTYRQAGRAFLLVAFSFGITTFLIHYAIVLSLNVGGRPVWALSAALSCTGAHIVVPVANRFISGSPLRPLLTVESAFSDAIAVLTVFALVGFESNGYVAASSFASMGYSFLLGGGIALISGFLWLQLLGRFYSIRYFYLMTIGFVFLMMGIVEKFHGNGAFSVFFFGLVLGNGETLLSLFQTRFRARLRGLFADGKISLYPRIAETHAEFSFLIRSFFFVYLGIVFRWPGTDFRLWLAMLLVLVSVVVGRESAVQLAGWVARVPAPQRRILGAMIPRGLATAVLSTILIPYAGDQSASWSTLAVFVVLSTNVLMAVRLAKLPESKAGRNGES